MKPALMVAIVAWTVMIVLGLVLTARANNGLSRFGGLGFMLVGAAGVVYAVRSRNSPPQQ